MIDDDSTCAAFPSLDGPPTASATDVAAVTCCDYLSPATTECYCYRHFCCYDSTATATAGASATACTATETTYTMPHILYSANYYILLSTAVTYYTIFTIQTRMIATCFPPIIDEGSYHKIKQEYIISRRFHMFSWTASR